MWPFKRKKKKLKKGPLPSIDGDFLVKDEAMPSLPSMSGVDVESPVGFNISRVDNGYYVSVNYQKISSGRRGNRLVFGSSKKVADYIKKGFDELEEEIKIEKLKQ